MTGARVCSSPDLLPLSNNKNHEDLSLEGIATNVKLLLKLVQDHQDASHKGVFDERKSQRFAGMMTILDDVKTRLHKSQVSSSGTKSKAELRRCNTDLKITCPPKDGTKRGDEGIIIMIDEKERLRRDLHTSFAAQKRLGAMCASLGREKEIIARELTRKVQELSEMEQLVSDLRAQNERLSNKIQAYVVVDDDTKDTTKKKNGNNAAGELDDDLSAIAAMQERNKELYDQLLKSLQGYKSIKRRLKETHEEKQGIKATIEELGDEIELGLEQTRNLKQLIIITTHDLGDERAGQIQEYIDALHRVFSMLQLSVSKHRKEGVQ